MSKTRASCFITGSKHLETDESTRPAASCFHLFLGVWNPWWSTRPRFWHITWRQVCLFLVFMWRNHIPKLNITLPSDVLISSDKRPYSYLTFHKVLARQGSSNCNRPRLNFRPFSLRDMTMTAREGCRVAQKMSYRSSFCQLNSACTRRNIYFNVSDL